MFMYKYVFAFLYLFIVNACIQVDSTLTFFMISTFYIILHSKLLFMGHFFKKSIFLHKLFHPVFDDLWSIILVGSKNC